MAVTSSPMKVMKKAPAAKAKAKGAMKAKAAQQPVRGTKALNKAKEQAEHLEWVHRTVEITNTKPHLAKTIHDQAVAASEDRAGRMRLDKFPNTQLYVKQLTDPYLISVMQKYVHMDTTFDEEGWARIRAMPTCKFGEYEGVSGVQCLFYILTARTPGLRLGCANRHVYTYKAVEEHAQLPGRSVRKLPVDPATGYIDYKKIGYYTLKCREGKLDKIRFIDGQEA